jgi:hypothetical protein
MGLDYALTCIIGLTAIIVTLTVLFKSLKRLFAAVTECIGALDLLIKRVRRFRRTLRRNKAPGRLTSPSLSIHGALIGRAKRTPTFLWAIAIGRHCHKEMGDASAPPISRRADSNK